MNPITLFWKGIATIATGISLVFGGSVQAPQQNLAASIPVTVAVFESSLAAPILTTSATSFTLVNGTDKAGNALSGLIGFVINEGASNEEFVLCTASSTAVSGCTRGISPVTGNTSVAALAKTHRRGESVKITDHPQLAIVSRILNGDETLPNPLKYSTTTSAYITSSEQLTHKGYVDGIVVAGGVPADNSTPGISRIATPQNLAEGTANLGVYAYSAPSTAFNATSSATTTVPVTKTNGKLSQGFLDLTEPFTFSGGVTSTGSLAVSGTVSLSTTTFSQIPTIPTSTPTLSSEVASKSYADSVAITKYASTATSTFSRMLNTGTISSLTATSSVPTDAMWGVVGISCSIVDNNISLATSYSSTVVDRINTKTLSVPGVVGSAGSTRIFSVSATSSVAYITCSGESVSTNGHSYTVSGNISWFK